MTARPAFPPLASQAEIDRASLAIRCLIAARKAVGFAAFLVAVWAAVTLAVVGVAA